MDLACALPLPELAHLDAELLVLQHLEDLVCSSGDDIMMECEIDGPVGTNVTWYRNSQILRNKGRFRLIHDNIIHRLEIKNVRDVDQGAYCVVAKYGNAQAFTKAFLLVPMVRSNEVAYYNINPYECTRITRHMNPVLVRPGEKIELLVLKETYVHIRHYWYKDDVEISPSERIFIDNTDDTAHLVIKNATEDDAGIYVLVMKTRDGVLSSYAGVNVLEDIDPLQVSAPSITIPLPRTIAALENQYMKMICRGSYDVDTRVEWFMNDVLIDDIQVMQEDYGNGMMALKIYDAFSELSARYKVVMVNDITGQTASSACNLTVNRSIMAVAPPTDIVKPLDSAVASCGSKVVFDCAFSHDNHHKLSVVWYVGRYKVERSNRMFSVISKGGIFILHIKKMSLDMSGEVICEVHHWLHSPRAAHVCQSFAHLTMVPPGWLDDSLGDVKPKHFIKGSHYRSRVIPKEGPALPSPYIRLVTALRPIKFKFCLLDEEGSYYFYTKTRPDVKIYYNPPPRGTRRNMKQIGLFQWDNKSAPGAWYSVAFQNDEGTFIEVGIARRPMLEIEVPPVERMLIFQVLAIPPVACMYRPMVCFSTRHELEFSVPYNRRVRQYHKFSQTYARREEMIGSGAFGRVCLIEDEFGDSFAGKVMKLDVPTKQGVALREFFMLRRLKHENVIGVVDSYVNNDLVTLVMYYAWGGELLERVSRDQHINESDIPACIKQVLDGLAYIHSQNVVHLDLKPENIVFAHPNSLQIKLVDFGLSRVLFEGSKIKAVYGTREYVAPEILKFEPVHWNSDMWSLGVCIYMMLSGKMPFESNTEAELTGKILRAEYDYEDPAFRTISNTAKNFIDHLLVPQPRSRLRAQDALMHPWIVCGPDKGHSSGDMELARVRLMYHMEEYRAKWKRAAGILLAVERLGLPVPARQRPIRLQYIVS